MLRIHIPQIVDASMHYANSVTIDQSSCRLSGVRKTTNQVYLRREFLFNFLNPHEKLTLLVLYSPFTFPGMKMIDMEWMRGQFSCTKLGSSDHTDNLGRPGSGNVGPGSLDGPLVMSSTCRSKIYRDFNEWCDWENGKKVLEDRKYNILPIVEREQQSDELINHVKGRVYSCWCAGLHTTLMLLFKHLNIFHRSLDIF